MRWIKILFFLCSFSTAVTAAEGERPPNIVFILADDLGINDLSCYGRKDHFTPNLDRLAAEGIRFTSAYCAQPICSPSRAALLTGKTPARLHLTTYLPGRANAPSQKVLHPEMKQALPVENMTIAEYLKQKGYATACIGKWHLGGKGHSPQEQGFDFVHAGKAETIPSAIEGGKGEYDLTTKAEEFMEAHRDEPFFLYLPHNTPHINYSSRSNLVEKYRNSFEPVYAALMETMDDSVGRILKKLEQLDLAKNTIVIFTSDNGGLHVPEGKHAKITFNTPFRAGKGYLYEGGTRIPLIVRWPAKIKPGRVTDLSVINTDWLPTFMEIAGVPLAERLDGISLASFLVAGKQPPSRRLFWHFPHYTNQGSRPAGAVRHGKWKLIEYYDTGELELYDLSMDISEKTNLVAREASLVSELKAALAAWRQEVGAQENRPNPNFIPNLFTELYVTTDPSRYQPETVDVVGLQRMTEWRRKMNAALK